MSKRNDFLHKRFSDTVNFPYGFSRAGDFSFAESRLLEQFGCLCQALCNNEINDLTAEDEQFLDVIAGHASATTQLEHTWLKYLRLSRRNAVVLRPKNNMQVERGKTAEAF